MRYILFIVSYLILPLNRAAASGMVSVVLEDGDREPIRGATVDVLGYSRLKGVTDDTGTLCGEYSGPGTAVQITISHPDFKTISNKQVYVSQECDGAALKNATIQMVRRGPTLERSEKRQPTNAARPGGNTGLRFRGYVQDRQGNPIHNVQISTHDSCLATPYTDSQGFFVIDASGCATAREFQVDLRASGFQLHTATISLTDHATPAQKIVLDRPLGYDSSALSAASIREGAATSVDVGGSSVSSGAGLAITLAAGAVLSGGASLVLWRLREGKVDQFNETRGCGEDLYNRGSSGCRRLYDAGTDFQQWSMVSLLGALVLGGAAGYFALFPPQLKLNIVGSSCSAASLATGLNCTVHF